MTRLSLGLVATVAAALAGCGSPTLLTEWGSAPATSVPLVCGQGGYQVRTKEDPVTKENRLLVTAYAVTEALRSTCANDVPAVAGAPRLRYQDAAERFLVAKRKPGCRITGGQELDALHSEFIFVCPDQQS